METEIIPKVKHLIEQYKTPILFSGTSIAKALATMISGFVTARFILPSDYGLWTLINLAVTYSVFLQAGFINGLNFELPYAYGRGEEDKAKIMAGTVQTFTIISAGLIFILGLTYSFLFAQDAKIKYGVLSITLFIMFSFYQNYLISTFRSKDSFLKLSYIQIVDVFTTLFSLFLVVYYSYYGLIIKSVLVISIYVFLLHVNRPIKSKLLWDKSAIIQLLRTGLPIFGLAYIVTLTSTFDRLLLSRYSSLTNVGLYSFAFSLFIVFSLFSNSIANYMYPRMTYNYGKNKDKIILWQYIRKITVLLFIVQLFLAIVGYYVIPFLVTSYFPKYILGISAMQILLFAGVCNGSVVGVNALWSMKIWKYMIIYQVIFSLLSIIFPYIGILFFSNKLAGVASGVLVANFLNLISGVSLTYLATHERFFLKHEKS